MEQLKQHQLHTLVPESLHEDLKKILPDHGGITSLIRAFLFNYVAEYNKSKKAGNSTPFYVASKTTSDNSILTSHTIEENKDEDEYRGG